MPLAVVGRLTDGRFTVFVPGAIAVRNSSVAAIVCEPFLSLCYPWSCSVLAGAVFDRWVNPWKPPSQCPLERFAKPTASAGRLLIG